MKSIAQEKSYQFALEIIELYKVLKYQKREFVLSTQVLKSGTSIGANVEEALGSQSPRDFLAKISIAYKEARETKYWLRLLRSSNILNGSVVEKPISDSDELIRILGSIQMTMRNKLDKKK